MTRTHALHMMALFAKWLTFLTGMALAVLLFTLMIVSSELRKHWILVPLGIAIVVGVTCFVARFVHRKTPHWLCGLIGHTRGAPEHKSEGFGEDVYEDAYVGGGADYTCERRCVGTNVLGVREWTEVQCVYCEMILDATTPVEHRY